MGSSTVTSPQSRINADRKGQAGQVTVEAQRRGGFGVFGNGSDDRSRRATGHSHMQHATSCRDHMRRRRRRITFHAELGDCTEAQDVVCGHPGCGVAFVNPSKTSSPIVLTILHTGDRHNGAAEGSGLGDVGQGATGTGGSTAAPSWQGMTMMQSCPEAEIWASALQQSNSSTTPWGSLHAPAARGQKLELKSIMTENSLERGTFPVRNMPAATCPFALDGIVSSCPLTPPLLRSSTAGTLAPGPGSGSVHWILAVLSLRYARPNPHVKYEATCVLDEYTTGQPLLRHFRVYHR
ncbi:hypothetical protein K461DRAFT_151125 [Myriangium duriaei CBS 260.36]|uniref:Uncharacterized protein n=1 Tax=Myriangium duriaei CBS 260.36 TaxID=1168546 RepID=A0A9P4J3P2_9PEZI|nr:hypothetical protein K461DRAFT_151125 [Myriangium duriaei CBS 260.36]